MSDEGSMKSFTRLNLNKHMNGGMHSHDAQPRRTTSTRSNEMDGLDTKSVPNLP
jgi:hypothetical protein